MESPISRIDVVSGAAGSKAVAAFLTTTACRLADGRGWHTLMVCRKVEMGTPKRLTGQKWGAVKSKSIIACLVARVIGCIATPLILASVTTPQQTTQDTTLAISADPACLAELKFSP
jgi:hypothetical protein